MKNNYLKKIILQAGLAGMIILLFLLVGIPNAIADIYEPEGLNMPGGWNGWTNPPTNNLALASYTQVPNGRVTKIATGTPGTPRWQTIFSVAASGGDIVGGSYPWLFTSGPSGNPWGNKWAGTTVVMNTLQSYSFNSGPDNQITVTNGKWYTMNWKDNGYANSQAIYMVTSAAPINISTVTVPLLAAVGVPVTVTVTLSASKSAEEIIYLRYTTDNWASSSLLTVAVSGTSGTAVIPGQPSGTTVKCYAFSSTVTGITANYDMYSIKINNNSGSYYSYPVGAPPISWANLASPPSASINPGSTVDVYGQAYIAGATGGTTPAPGVQAWIGYSTANTNPNTWTNWVSASYVGAAGSNDQYKAAIGIGLTPGTYYYSSRFQQNLDPYVYGGYSASGGGLWDGTTNVSGILTVNGAPPAVTTGTVTAITATSANVSGTVVSDGGSPVTARGICYSTSPDPTLADNFTVNGTGTGSFTATLSSLSGGTTYHARAYATNVHGTSYGSDVEFTTLYAVTFNVDMITANGFIPGTDSVFLAGSFPGATWNEPGTNPALKMAQVGSTLIYTLTLSLPSGSYEFKHFKNAGWGGGEWSGGTNRSVTVSGNTTLNNTWGGELNWANLQGPASGTILPSSNFEVYAQAYIPNGKTGVAGGAYGLACWIGYSGSNTDPSTWTNWVAAPYFGAAGGNDEFKAEIGTLITTAGTYYYASRFKLGNNSYVYGGYNSGFWDGTTNVSGVLSVVNGFVLAVTTESVSSVTSGSAVVTGNVLADGGNPVTSRGICWSTNPNPTLADNYTIDGSGLGLFSGSLTSLSSGTQYYARAYAINSTDTAYGSDLEFTTQYIVTFNVDMSTAQGFLPGSDLVYLAGSFPGSTWVQPGDDPTMLMSLTGGYVYSLQLALPAGTYAFKHFINAGWGGGEWTGGSNRSVTISSNITLNSIWGGEINWVNLQWPDAGTIDLGGAYDVYAQVYIPNGRTGVTGGAYGIQAWIGISSTNNNPETWTEWYPATYNGPAGDNDEYKTDLGSVILSTGTYYYASRFQAGDGPYVYGGYSATGGGYWDGTNNVSGVLTVNEAVKTLNLKLYLEGLYAGNNLMNQVKNELAEPVFGGTVVDTLTIELHNAANYGLIEYQVHGVELNTNGDINLSGSSGIPSVHNGDYYITIRHRNSILTTTVLPVSFAGSTISYDFSTGAGQAFGSNLQNMNGVYAIFGGDENQDQLVDSSDMIDADNDAAAFAVGYIPTDVNGDGLVDSSDMILIDNNSTAFVASVLP